MHDIVTTVADEEVLKQLPADLIIPGNQLQMFDNTIGQGTIHHTAAAGSHGFMIFVFVR